MKGIVSPIQGGFTFLVSNILSYETAQLFEPVSLRHADPDRQHHQEAQDGSHGYFTNASDSYLP